jgi:hypothetical protein
MSLWTPDGERPVSRPAATPTGPAAPADGPDRPNLPPEIEAELASLGPEERAQAEAMLAEMAETQYRIANTPAADVVANHLMGFYELGAIHLQQDPPNFVEATVAIDAMRAVLDGLGERLGEHGVVLTQALQQLQMAFVELKKQGAPEA